MKPTMKLRRTVHECSFGEIEKMGFDRIFVTRFNSKYLYPVLQQWWEDEDGQGEWRDVPWEVE